MMDVANMFYKNYIRIGVKTEIEIRIKKKNLISRFELTDLRVRVKKGYSVLSNCQNNMTLTDIIVFKTFKEQFELWLVVYKKI